MGARASSRTTAPPRHLVVVTSSRADLAHLIWPLRALRAEPSLRLTIMACGAALSEEYGSAAARLREEGFEVLDVGEPLGIDTPAQMAAAVGSLTRDFAEALALAPPDLLLVIADRVEMLAPATAALAMRIPIIHIEGGELSEGAIDNAVRNALTAMSHVHLVTTEAARLRVIAMGEEPWRVHQVGAASLDHLRHATLPPLTEVLIPTGLAPSHPLLLVAVHPTTLADEPDADAVAILAALTMLDQAGPLRSAQVLFAFPNADDGGRTVRRHCEAWCLRRSSTASPIARLVTQLPAEWWFALLDSPRTVAIVGNSSSIVMEAPAAGLPSVLVGERQRGRELSPSTQWVTGASAQVPFGTPTALEIALAIEAAVTVGWSPQPRDRWPSNHPYGDGRAAERIAQAIRGLPDRAALLNKHAGATNSPGVFAKPLLLK